MSTFGDDFAGLFAPMPVLFDSRPRTNPLLASKFCAMCGHRESWHDGNQGVCRFGDCFCTGFYNARPENRPDRVTSSSDPSVNPHAGPDVHRPHGDPAGRRGDE